MHKGDLADASNATPTPTAGAHTPGPWYFESDDTDTDFEGFVVYTATDRKIAMIHGGWNYRRSHLANARLIAAAPDLLAAASLLLARYVDLINCGDCGHWDPETESEVIAVRAAIAEATGSASKATQSG